LKLQITIDGKSYEVEVELLEEDDAGERPPAFASYQPAPATFQSMPFPSSPSHGSIDEDVDEVKVCRSPVTGLVIKVNVEPGQTVEANALVMVLEAMKMEANVTAPGTGTVKSVNVAPGDSVKAGQVIVEFE
jgi:methylmalonyl-CoA carboxyltransferase small subunit